MGHDAEGRVSGEFERTAEGVVATLTPLEVALLRQFVTELRTLLEAEAGAGGRDAEPGSPPASTEAQLFAAISGLDEDGPVILPDDPVLARLFPDAYPDDPESSGDFRRFTQDRLVDRKYTACAAVLAMLPESADEPVRVVLDDPGIRDWLGALNDVRLALATRLGVAQDDDDYWEGLPGDDPRGTVHEIYQWLGWVQETLVRALS